MYVCMYVYIYIYIHICIHIYIYIYMLGLRDHDVGFAVMSLSERAWPRGNESTRGHADPGGAA